MPSPDSEDALLADCSAARMKTIAKAMHLTGFARLLKADLETLISTAMLQVTECPTCGGGQCRPAEHYFSPVISASVSSSPDHNALAGLGAGDLQDELFGGEDGLAPTSFITGQATQPGSTPNLALNIQQGGLDVAASAARDAESLDPIQIRINEALATEAAALAQERLDAAAARERELEEFQQAEADKAASEAQFQSLLQAQRQKLREEHQRILDSEASIAAARRTAMVSAPVRQPAPIIRAQPPTPRHTTAPISVPGTSHASRPPCPPAPAQQDGFLRPPPPLHQFHPDTSSAPAPHSAPAGSGNLFDFANLERVMVTALTAAINANKPPPTSLASAWPAERFPPGSNPAIENKGRLKINPMPNQNMVQLFTINL